MDLLHRTCNYGRTIVERVLARGFVVFGGLFWVAAALGAVSYLNDSPLHSPMAALIPLGLAVVALLVGWFYERLAAVLLFAGAIAVVIWGVLAAWPFGVWVLMVVALIGELLIAGLLFLLAARSERVCELEESKSA